MKRKSVWLIAAVLLISAAWFFYAPYHTVYRMREAASNRDPVALARYINFPSVRESLKANVSARLLSDMSEARSAGPFAAMGAALAMALVGPIVDAMVTPEALAMMMQGETPPLEKRNETTVPRAPSPPTSSPPSSAPSEPSRPETEISMHYESFDRFVVNARKRQSSNDPVVFVLEREGLFAWKLSAIRLPL